MSCCLARPFAFAARFRVSTGYFLERMGFTSLDELPPLAPHLPGMDDLEGIDGLADLRSAGPARAPAAQAPDEAVSTDAARDEGTDEGQG